MRFINLYLFGYFILILGIGIAMREAGVFSGAGPVWIAIWALVAIGLGIMLAVTSGEPRIAETVQP